MSFPLIEYLLPAASANDTLHKSQPPYIPKTRIHRSQILQPGKKNVLHFLRSALFHRRQQAAALRSESVLNAFGHVEDIAYCVWYLASDAAKFVTGQEFVIDGGTTIK